MFQTSLCHIVDTNGTKKKVSNVKLPRHAQGQKIHQVEMHSTMRINKCRKVHGTIF